MPISILQQHGMILTDLYTKKAEDAIELICDVMKPSMLSKCYSIVFKNWSFRICSGELGLSICGGGLIETSGGSLQPNPFYRDANIIDTLCLENFKHMLRNFSRKNIDSNDETVKNAKIICKEIMLQKEKQSEEFRLLQGSAFDPFVSNALVSMFDELNSLLSRNFFQESDDARKRLKKIEDVRKSINKVIKKALAVADK